MSPRDAHGSVRPRTGEHGLGLVGLLVSLVVVAAVAGIALATLGSSTSLPAGVGSLPGTTAKPGTTPGGAGDGTSSGGSSQPAGIGAAAGAAADEVAQQNLQRALSAADQAALAGGGDYGSLRASSLSASTRGLVYVAATSTGAGVVSLATSQAGGSVTMAVRSATGSCWLAWRTASVTWLGAGPTGGPCLAAAMSSAPSPGTGAGGIRWQQGSFP
ncbi:MAG TPA: hypothetical protein VMU09_11285 [Acidimicrobiales bacterium]|nr:hypothetical protein [Acidimicrobiales bacterium]